jgi:catechol 2,3-dioxygenase-like lactoylglutathione lyase family enzyme
MKALFALAIMTSSVLSLSLQKAPSPALLDDIHYYVRDRKAAEAFFIERFAARVIPHPGPKSLEFITFLSLRPGQGTINVSLRGPFPGISVEDPNRWKREVVEPSENLPPKYGVYWLGIRAPFLNQTLTRLEIEGVRVTQRMLSLPHDILARAALIEGPDFNQIALVERKQRPRPNPDDQRIWGDFSIDHLMLLVKSVKENEQFLRDVFAGRVIGRRPRVTTMKIADATIVLAEPEALGFKREQVQTHDPRKFRYGIDHLGFLYADVKAAVEAAKAKGYRFLLDGVRMRYFDTPTVYTCAITFNPDGLRFEMVQEDGRTKARIHFLQQ